MLSGDVEVDEMFFGGVKPGKRAAALLVRRSWQSPSNSRYRRDTVGSGQDGRDPRRDGANPE